MGFAGIDGKEGEPHDCPPAAGVASADHLLTLRFQEGTSRLATAALVPDTADVGDAVRDFCGAQADAEADLPLSSLVSLLVHQYRCQSLWSAIVWPLHARLTGAFAC